MFTDVKTFCISPQTRISQALTAMNRRGLGIVVVVDSNMRLIGLVTDGDMRRAYMNNISTKDSVERLLQLKIGSRSERPISATVGRTREFYLRIMKKNKILHLPVLDASQRVVGLLAIDEFTPSSDLPVEAVIMAGGRGRRLRPLTDNVPKPMLKVAGRPILELIIDRLRESGIRRVNITTHHLRDKIVDYFKDGGDFGVEVSYVSEDRPLGTAGALSLLKVPDQTTLIINGDVLTDVDFRAMLAFHHEMSANLTVAICRRVFTVPYGVVECDGSRVSRLTEKPSLNFTVNAGIYLLEPSVFSFVPAGMPFDMPDLIRRLMKENRTVAAFPVHEYWRDIGRRRDYHSVKRRLRSGAKI